MVLVKLVLTFTDVNIWHTIIVLVLYMSEFFRNFSMFSRNDNTKSFIGLEKNTKLLNIYLQETPFTTCDYCLFSWTSVLLLSNLHRKLFYMT